MEILDTGEDVRHNEDIALERILRVVGDKIMEMKVSSVEGGTVLQSSQELAIENAQIVCIGHDKGFHSVKVRQHCQEWHQRTVEKVEGGEWSHMIIEDMMLCCTIVLQYSLMSSLMKILG